MAIRQPAPLPEQLDQQPAQTTTPLVNPPPNFAGVGGANPLQQQLQGQSVPAAAPGGFTRDMLKQAIQGQRTLGTGADGSRTLPGGGAVGVGSDKFGLVGTGGGGGAGGDTPQPDPYKGINDFYGNLTQQQDADWGKQQGMLQGQMAGFSRQADSLNARMGGSIAGGYAGLGGAALGQGMDAYNKASLAYNQLRQATGKDQFNALERERETLRGRDWAKEDVQTDFENQIALHNLDNPSDNTASGKRIAYYDNPESGASSQIAKSPLSESEKAKASELYKQWVETKDDQILYQIEKMVEDAGGTFDRYSEASSTSGGGQQHTMEEAESKIKSVFGGGARGNAAYDNAVQKFGEDNPNEIYAYALYTKDLWAGKAKTGDSGFNDWKKKHGY